MAGGQLAMAPDGGGGSLETFKALGEEPGDEARQHVARAGSGKPGGGIGVDAGAAFGMGDHRIGPLQDDDGLGLVGGLAGGFKS